MRPAKRLFTIVSVFLVLDACTAETDPIPGAADSGVTPSADASPNSPDAGDTSGCPALTSSDIGIHIVANVSWPATTGVVAGSDVVHIWTLSSLDYAGGNVTGRSRPCGSIVPPLEASQLLGGGMIQPVIPDEVWDATSLPDSPTSGTIGGFDAGDTIDMQPVVSLIGASMDNPADGAWPSTGAELSGMDHDDSGKSGVTSVPRSDPPFRRPPLDIIGAVLPDGARADVLYLAMRNVIRIQGNLDSCNTGSGTATFLKFDNHVIGCHVLNGGECTAAQADFVDSNRTVFQVSDATFTMRRMPEGSACADVRTALP